MQNLQTLIDMLTAGRNLHINILDLGGILKTEATVISTKNTIHSKEFCDVAKSTAKGYGRCIRCKNLANEKAARGESFCSHCPFGLYEAAVPVFRGKSVVAVVYVGNFVVDKEHSLRLIERSERIVGVAGERLSALLDRCEYTADREEPLKIAELVRDYLTVLLERDKNPISTMSWLTLRLKSYADEFYMGEVSLKKLAESYRKNEKYLGRIFKSDMGISFSEYCNSLRLRRAVKMLLSGDEKIIDIALECGFNNIAYFNRLFAKKYGMSPSEYRLTNRGSRDIIS